MDFVEWLEAELSNRGWTRSELSRRGDLTTAQVSRIMTRQQNPGPAFCEGIAKAFRVPLEEVYRRAGLLDPLNPTDARKQRINNYLNEMSPEELEVAERVLQSLTGGKKNRPKTKRRGIVQSPNPP